MRVRLTSESGAWVILDAMDDVTTRMTGTQLLRYIEKFVMKYCPEETHGNRFRVEVELRK